MENSLDLSAILSGLGSDPAAIGAIAELLKGMSNVSPRPQQSAPSAETGNFPQFTASSQSPPTLNQGNGSLGGGISPELLGSLFSMLGQGNGGQKSGASSRPDPQEQPNALGKLLGDKSDSENRLRLLNALRPYLSEERREKLDMLLKLLKLAELGKLSGILSSV